MRAGVDPMLPQALRSVAYAVPVAALVGAAWWLAAGGPLSPAVAVAVAAVGWQAWLLRRHLLVARQVNLDQLTGLPGRVLLRERLRTVLGHGRPVALVFVDLDGFKRVNDAYGHAAGDRMLVDVARRLERAAGQGAFVARYGGDEFAIVIRAGAPVARDVAARVVRALSWPASVGLAVSDGGDADPEALVVAADAAMYAAKPE
ncbi:MAG TPA: GGDEF domain-containing protein [Jiangellaceae bacterium]|nr:GGDEF domain-containing protein [Jiangellaceae bacterium]